MTPPTFSSTGEDSLQHLESEIAFFNQHAWVKPYLAISSIHPLYTQTQTQSPSQSQSPSKSEWLTTPTPSRIKGKDYDEDAFLSETLSGTETIAHSLILYKQPVESETTSVPVTKIRWLFTFGRGVTGWPGTCHGGMVATILDEAMGFVMSLNQRYFPGFKIRPPTTSSAVPGSEGGDTAGEKKKAKEEEDEIDNRLALTASLQVEYKNRVPTGQVLLCNAWLEKTERRKVFLEATIEDARGKVLARGKALYVRLTTKMARATIPEGGQWPRGGPKL